MCHVKRVQRLQPDTEGKYGETYICWENGFMWEEPRFEQKLTLVHATQEKENKVNAIPFLGTKNGQFYATTLESKHTTVL